MPLLLLPPTACATGAAAAPALSAAFSRPPPSSRLRCSHLPFAFPRLRKYGRRHREPVAAPTSDDNDDDDETEAEDGDYDDDDEEIEMAVDEEEFLATRPKPMGFGEGKTYSTDIEEQLLREMGLGGARSKGDATSTMRRVGNGSAKETNADLIDNGVQVRVWNLPKKKNIHKDLKQAFKGFHGLLSIDPVVSANKKTRDPICKGFAYLKLESTDAATRVLHILSWSLQMLQPDSLRHTLVNLCHLARLRSQSVVVLSMGTALLSLQIKRPMRFNQDRSSKIWWLQVESTLICHPVVVHILQRSQVC